jgi:hypothetical protein
MPSRKDLIRAYKEQPTVGGLWLIRNLRNGKVLLGTALNLNARVNRHRFELNLGRHDCAELQADYKALGPEAFSIEAAEQMKVPEDDPLFEPREGLTKMERAWMEKLRPFGDKGYHEAP